jgi:hypothetical protein
MRTNSERKKYVDIENIINLKFIITDVPIVVSEWFYINRNHLTWELFDNDKVIPNKIDRVIIECVEQKFSREQELSKHTMVTDGYFRSFILSMTQQIKNNYEKYLTTQSTTRIRKYLFYLIVILYSLETQHYYHVVSRGKKFKNILSVYSDLFNKIQEFAYSTTFDFVKNNIPITKWGLVGEIDLIENNCNEAVIWEIKCVSDITLKNILQVLLYNMMFCNDIIQKNNISVNFINFLKNEIIRIKINMTTTEVDRIKQIFLETGQLKNTC